ncbi:MAG: hypothetical protein AAGD05_03010 [Bacteroidota bacterium]
MNKLIFSLLLTCGFQLTGAQVQDQLQQHFETLQQGKTSVLSKSTTTAAAKDEQSIATLQPFLQATAPEVQREAVRLTAVIGAQHTAPTSRTQAVNQLLKTAEGTSTALLGQISRQLRQFNRADFDGQATQQLARLIRMERPHLSKLIELAGFLQMRDLLNEIRIHHQKDKYLRQSIGMALTRSGDEQKQENLLKNVKKLRVNDDFVYGILPKLVYVRQKETTNYLFGLILEDQKNCSPPGHSVPGKVNCAYRVMEALAPYIKDLPVTVGPSGDLAVDDYAQALQTTRQWILDHQDHYELRTDIY